MIVCLLGLIDMDYVQNFYCCLCCTHTCLQNPFLMYKLKAHSTLRYSRNSLRYCVANFCDLVLIGLHDSSESFSKKPSVQRSGRTVLAMKKDRSSTEVPKQDIWRTRPSVQSPYPVQPHFSTVISSMIFLPTRSFLGGNAVHWREKTRIDDSVYNMPLSAG